MDRQPQSPDAPTSSLKRDRAAGTRTRMIAAISRILAGSHAISTPLARTERQPANSDQQVEWALRLMS